jgi:hypothetical protein
MYNVHVPLPLAVGTIMTRAETQWYRTLPQLRTDIDLILSNAELLYQQGHSVIGKASDIHSNLHRVIDCGVLEDDEHDNTAEEEGAQDDDTEKEAAHGGQYGAGTSGASTSRAAALLADSPDVSHLRVTRQRRGVAAVDVEETPRRETRKRSARLMLSPEPESPDESGRRTRALRKRRACAPGSWAGMGLSEERSQEPVIDRPRRATRQQTTYA